MTWAFFVYGVTLVVTGSKIFAPLRQRIPGTLLRCPMCFGWWVGLATALFGRWGAVPVEFGGLVGWSIANAFCASAVCWTFHVVLSKLGAEDL